MSKSSGWRTSFENRKLLEGGDPAGHKFNLIEVLRGHFVSNRSLNITESKSDLKFVQSELHNSVKHSLTSRISRKVA